MHNLRKYIKDLLDAEWQAGHKCEPGELQKAPLDPEENLTNICNTITDMVKNAEPLDVHFDTRGYLLVGMIDPDSDLGDEYET